MIQNQTPKRQSKATEWNTEPGDYLLFLDSISWKSQLGEIVPILEVELMKFLYPKTFPWTYKLDAFIAQPYFTHWRWSKKKPYLMLD